MKRLPVALYVLISVFVISCTHHNKNTSISYRISGGHYSMKAHFDKIKTKDVEEYLNKRIGDKMNVSLLQNKIDETIILEDRTVFYMEKSPGRLNIKMDIDENSNEAYEKIRSMCEGLKEVVAGTE